jgi:predicted NBD/HSP70 family sugar kinase
VETLVSTRGLLQSFEAVRRCPGEWTELIAWVSRYGVASWLAEALDAVAIVIAGALNVLGVRRVVVTGSILELGTVVHEHLANAVRKGTMWARFGTVECVVAPRRRTAGLVAVGMDRLVLPVGDADRPPPRPAGHSLAGRKATEGTSSRKQRR